MTALQLTIAVEAADRDSARRAVEAAGFTIVRFSAAKAASSKVTPPTEDLRASAALDRPAGLDKLERAAYVRGYAKACMAFVKKHGAPLRAEGEDRSSLHKRTVEHEWERHPAAHKAGMSELARHRETTAAYRVARQSRAAA